jgi:hypothetical protein
MGNCIYSLFLDSLIQLIELRAIVVVCEFKNQKTIFKKRKEINLIAQGAKLLLQKLQEAEHDNSKTYTDEV